MTNSLILHLWNIRNRIFHKNVTERKFGIIMYSILRTCQWNLHKHFKSKLNRYLLDQDIGLFVFNILYHQLHIIEVFSVNIL